MGNGTVLDEKNCVGASNALFGRAIGTNTLGEATKVVGHAAEPQGLIRTLTEVTVVHGLAGGGVNHSMSRRVGVDDVRTRRVEPW